MQTGPFNFIEEKSLFDSIDNCFKGFRVVHRQVGKYLAVQVDVLVFEFTDEYRVAHTFHPCTGVDTLYPQGTEASFFGFTVTVRIL